MAKRKSTKDKQRSTKHTHKTKDRVTHRVNSWASWVWSLANVTAKASCIRSPYVRVNGMFNAFIPLFEDRGPELRTMDNKVTGED
jgi:hypothetical protein